MLTEVKYIKNKSFMQVG